MQQMKEMYTKTQPENTNIFSFIKSYDYGDLSLPCFPFAGYLFKEQLF